MPTDPLAFLADEVAELKRQNLSRPLRVMSSPQAADELKRAVGKLHEAHKDLQEARGKLGGG